jgi:hypothetical protein
MFTRIPLVLASLFAATVIAVACDPPREDFPPLPRKPVPAVGPFPQVGTVVALDGKDQTIEYTVVVPVRVRDKFHLELDREPKALVAYRWEHRQITRKSKMDRLKFFDASGKPVATKDVWKRLSVGGTFFVSADGESVSAEHLKMIAKDVLVVVDHDNVLMERLIEELRLSVIDQGFEKPRPRPRPLPEPRPELR